MRLGRSRSPRDDGRSAWQTQPFMATVRMSSAAFSPAGSCPRTTRISGFSISSPRGLVGLLSVIFTVYMRMELMYPGVQYMCDEGARFIADADARVHAQRPPVERDDHLPRRPDDVLRGHSGAVRRLWQLFHAAADRRAGHGVSAAEQPVSYWLYVAGICAWRRLAAVAGR